jgi:hypothetical protein
MMLKQTFIVDASFNFSTMTTGIGLAIHETDKPNRNGILIDQITRLSRDFKCGNFFKI